MPVEQAIPNVQETSVNTSHDETYLHSATIFGFPNKPVPSWAKTSIHFYKNAEDKVVVEDILSFLEIAQTGQEPKYSYVDAMPQDPNMIKTSVWKMINMTTGDFVAAKRSHTHVTIQEAEILSVVRHPNIVEMVDLAMPYGKTKDVRIIMEWLHGGTLQDWIKKGNHTIEEVASVFDQVSAAINHVNQKGYIYADAKPLNIMFNDNNVVKLVDFENTQEMDSANSASVDVCFSTHNFAPPEQIHLDGKLFLETDVYSMAAVLFHMLTDQPQVLGKIDRDRFVTFQELSMPLRPEYEAALTPTQKERLAKILRKALSENYEERHCNVEELNKEVQSALVI